MLTFSARLTENKTHTGSRGPGIATSPLIRTSIMSAYPPVGSGLDDKESDTQSCSLPLRAWQRRFSEMGCLGFQGACQAS